MEQASWKRLFVECFFMKKTICKGTYFWKRLLAKGYRPLCKGNCLWKRPICKGISYGTGLLEHALCSVVSFMKKSFFVKTIFMEKGSLQRATGLFVKGIPYGKGLFVKGILYGKGSLQRAFFMEKGSF